MSFDPVKYMHETGLIREPTFSAPSFKVELLPYDDDNIKKSREVLEARIEQFIKSIESSGLTEEPCWSDLPEDLRRGGGYTLQALEYNLVAAEKYDSRRDKEKTKRRQERALSTFSHGELQELLFIISNGIFINVNETSPWDRPHGILWDAIGEFPDSLFHDSLSDDLTQRLHNGRLWESLFQLTYEDWRGMIVGDVLTEHREYIDANFIPEGMEILRKLEDKRCKGMGDFKFEFKPRVSMLGGEARWHLFEFMRTATTYLLSHDMPVDLLTPFYKVFADVNAPTYRGDPLWTPRKAKIVLSDQYVKKYGLGDEQQYLFNGTISYLAPDSLRLPEDLE